ncbi:MAG: hypothetical protein VST69_08455 [Nitrospirota bacterium]|nr:hypothetical protein [Nitrospirota bacterium]
MNQEIHIVALGARTPLGFDAESSAAAIRAGISHIKAHPFIVDRSAVPLRMALDNSLPADMMGPERFILLATSALEEICQQLGEQGSGIKHIPLLLCLPEERPGWNREDSEQVRNALTKKNWPLSFRSIQIFSEGHAAGLIALNAACKGIMAKEAELCVILGVDSYLNLDTLHHLDEGRQLATEYHRGAFFPGEGSGAVAIASGVLLQNLKLKSLATLRGTGIAKEPRSIKTENGSHGEGLTAAIESSLKSLRLPEEAIEGIVCDINGERYRSEEWGFAMLRLPKAFVDPTGYDLPSSCWGDVGAASGLLFIIIAVLAGEKGWAKGRRYMIWNSSEAGHRAAAVLELNLKTQGPA